MTIQLKVRDALLVSEGIKELPALPSECLKASYWFGRIQHVLNAYIVDYNKKRDVIVRSNGTLDTTTGNYTIAPDNFLHFQDSVDLLLDTDIVVPYNKIKVIDLQGVAINGGPNIKPDTFYKLITILDGFELDD